MIPYGKHNIGQQEIDAVSRQLKEGWLTQGQRVPEFEQAVASFCRAEFAVAVGNATQALHLSCLVLGVNSNSRVWTTANTFVASANCARYCGADVDFVDIDQPSGNLSIARLTEKLAQAKQQQQLPDVLVVVHYAGQPCDMAAIAKLAQQYQFKVIEDASHALGAQYANGGPVGNGEYSELTVFSFHPVKMITTAEGGMVLTSNVGLAEQLRRLRSHGIDQDLHSRGNSWQYDQAELGFNYRLSDIQAVIGIEQMKKLNDFVSRRNELAERYQQPIQQLGLAPMQIDHAACCSYHLFPILLPADTSDSQKQAMFESLRQFGIGVNVHYRPVYLHSYYRRLGFEPGYCAEAEQFYRRELSIPMYPDLTASEQGQVITALKASINAVFG